MPRVAKKIDMQIKRIKNYLRFIIVFTYAKLTSRRIPLIVILGVTNKCNLACSYCYGEHAKRNGWRDFTTEELLEIVKELGKLGTSILQLQGGEPLLRNDLPLIIEEAKKQGMICDMVTNGTMICSQKEVVRLLDRVCVSLDGPKQVNDKNRGEGVFDKSIEGIKEVLRMGLPVRISTVLTSDTTLADIDWLVDFAFANRVLLNFSPSFDFLPQTCVNSPKPHLINEDKLQLFFRHILKHKRNGALIQFSLKSYIISSEWPFGYSRRRIIKEEDAVGLNLPKCYHGELVFFIDADGSLYPCCNYWGRKTLNIRKDGLKESIAQLDHARYCGCYIPAYIDRNLFFDGDFKTWFNYLKQGVRGGL